MVVIRLVRTGSKKRPFYQIVAADKRFPLNGRYIESLGYYNPIARGQEKTVVINIDAVEAYVSKGAQCSDRFISVLKAYNKSLIAAGEDSVSKRLEKLTRPDSQKNTSKKTAATKKVEPAKKDTPAKKTAAAEKTPAKKTASSKKTAAKKTTTKVKKDS